MDTMDKGVAAETCRSSPSHNSGVLAAVSKVILQYMVIFFKNVLCWIEIHFANGIFMLYGVGI